MSTSSWWAGLVDDAAVFPPGNAPLAEAVPTYGARRGEARDLVASFVVTDTDLPGVRDAGGEGVPVSVVVSGGAGAVPGACRLARKAGTPLHALETALRDLDDLPGNTRRVVAAVDAARGDGLLEEEVPVFVELPPTALDRGPAAGWLAAADEVAMLAEDGFRLKLRTGGTEADRFPTAATLAAWIDAALDRETPFKCTAGLHHAVRTTDPDTGFEHHGFLNVLLATRAAFDGAATDEVVALLEERDGTVLAGRRDDLPGARRWFTSFGSCSVSEPLDDLTALGLLEDAR
jgi:hypothetical protein